MALTRKIRVVKIRIFAWRFAFGFSQFHTLFLMYHISVCLGTACFVKGSQKILDRLKERLQLEEGKTSPDGKFSLDTTRCVGACGIAPVFTVNKEVYGHATVKKLDEVLDALENEEEGGK